MSDNDVTSVRLYRDTKSRLESMGRMNESFDDVVNRLIDEHAAYQAKLRYEGAVPDDGESYDGDEIRPVPAGVENPSESLGESVGDSK